ncbi:Ig-like domain-containing protein [Marinobacter gudaonensis]|uniref:Ig-like domain-containing protein n=1 Tax=Marinobacter gudaonensis TaxID=375760 RepID=A0A1I6H9C1_9GAMM|nr:Ig-like domain-containing protein [Marinobacter gudaonensis]SFR51109.1 Ig-like domain-containing protein [Marinobacter gudaonensis]
MKYNKTLALIPALLLAACGGEEQAMKQNLGPGSVVYSYPSDGQEGISPTADVVLRFSHAITDDEATIRDKIVLSGDAGAVDYTVTKVDNGRSLKLSPTANLNVSSGYSVTFSTPLVTSGSNPVGTPNAQGPDGIQFTTRGGFSGIAGLDNLATDFAVARMIPAPDGELRPTDFSTFRLQLTQPVHPDWRAMGGQIVLEDSSGNAVPAEVIVDQRRITLDPCLTEEPVDCGSKADELTAGATYTLKVKDLPSLTSPGTTLNFEKSFTARETGPTVVLFQEVVDSGLLSGQEPRTSKLNGQIINGVTLNSVLQGNAGPSQQTGGLYAELAYAPSFEASEPLPLRIPRGSVLSSSSLDVKINGTVPVLNAESGQLQTTGDIKVTMISDATGYLLPNPYTDDLSAPRHVKLFMDVSMNTENAQPNASLTQDLLGVELSGIAIVENGMLTIDAIGIVEPELLGQEYTDSTIAFRIEAATDADSVLDAEELRTLDTTGPQLVSWMPGPDSAAPGDRDQMQRPGDPIVLNFDEPIDEDSLTDGLTLDEGGTPLTISEGTLKAYVDGTAVVINPTGGLEHDIAYSLNISGSLTDLAGNSAMSQSLDFALPAIDNGASGLPIASPLALTTYPGFPCVTTGVDLDAGTHGQCVDAAPGGPRGQVLPVTTLPEDRPIVVVFSQSMDLGTIRKGETFKVEKVNSDGTFSEIAGRLEKNNQRIRFYPDEPWQVGTHYRYTMASVGSLDCASAICSTKGYPLQTDLLVDPEDIGGPNMEIYFKGTESTGTVFTPLRNLPIRDVNANFVVDCATSDQKNCLEPFDHLSDGANGFSPSANAAKLGVAGKQATALGVPVGASVGCSASEDCPKNKFIYQTYALNTEIIGPEIDEETGKKGVRVLLYPTLLATTSASVFLDGFGEQSTGPQILRMTYGESTEDNSLGLVEGIIIEGEDGRPTFKTTAKLTLDAPNLSLPLASALSHDLYSKEFELNLAGPIVFFDDGRMQIEQRNSIASPIDVNVEVEVPLLGGFIDFFQCIDNGNSFTECLSGSGTDSGDINIPLEIPQQGVYLNFISNPIKEIPAEQ